MRSIKFFFYCVLLFSFQFIFFLQFLSAQETEMLPADTTIVEVVTIALADISIESGEAFITTQKIAESLIPDEQLDQLQINTDSILYGIDSLLRFDDITDFCLSIVFINSSIFIL